MNRLLDTEVWQPRWTPEAWRGFLQDPRAEDDAAAIRQNTHTGRPLGSESFIARLEEGLGRRLTPEKGGRPARGEVDERQEDFGF